MDYVVDIEYELQSFVRSVDEMLKYWVKKRHHSFIHRRFYDKGIPSCIQDGFTTLAASHISRTLAVEDVILQIAEERCKALVCQTSPPTSAHGIAARLALVQALFVYLFIRLFNRSIRVRASAGK